MFPGQVAQFIRSRLDLLSEGPTGNSLGEGRRREALRHLADHVQSLNPGRLDDQSLVILQ
jgi:hypothetical protein